MGNFLCSFFNTYIGPNSGLVGFAIGVLLVAAIIGFITGEDKRGIFSIAIGVAVVAAVVVGLPPALAGMGIRTC